MVPGALVTASAVISLVTEITNALESVSSIPRVDIQSEVNALDIEDAFNRFLCILESVRYRRLTWAVPQNDAQPQNGRDDAA